MNIGSKKSEAGLISLASRIIVLWAMAGGILLLLIVLMNVASIIGSTFFNMPLPGDVELVRMGVAIAIFNFLPYCQISDAHVKADIFTANASRKTISTLSIIAASVGIAISAVLLWRMFLGMFDYIEYQETTTVLQIPHWYAFIPILISLILCVVAGLISLFSKKPIVGLH